MTEMIYYPVIVPTLCRYEHFRALVESLAQNTHAQKTELYIALDFPAKEEHREGYEKIKAFIPKIKWFKNVETLYRTQNAGAGKNAIPLVELASKKYGAHIASEDDNVFSPNFLDYMNKCLNFLKDDDDVIAVSAYSQPVEFLKNESGIVLLGTYFSGWGCATWAKKREWFCAPMYGDYRKKVFSDKEKIKKLSRSIRAVNHTMEWLHSLPHLNGRACDIEYESEMIIQKKLCAFPQLSLVRNMGNDGSGVHCGIDERFSKQKIDTRTTYPADFSKINEAKKMIFENDRILENFLLKEMPKSEIKKTKAKLALTQKKGIDFCDEFFEKKRNQKSKFFMQKEKFKKTCIGKILLKIKRVFIPAK